MRISVIIPCYNSGETIAEQLDALASQHSAQPWEVIISDNGSTDGTREIVERYSGTIPKLRLVDSSDVRGPAHARNVGARAAAGDALLFCDSDDVVAPGWLSAMAEALSKHDFVAGRLEAEALNPGWLREACGQPDQRTRLGTLSYEPCVLYSGAGCLGVKRSLHMAIGGFDESLRCQEDTDYCIRIQLTGVELRLAPGALVHNRYRATFRGLFHQSRLYAAYNVLVAKRYRPVNVNIRKKCERIIRGWIHYLWGCRSLVTQLLKMRRKSGRARWFRMLGRQVGILQASLTYWTHPN